MKDTQPTDTADSLGALLNDEARMDSLAHEAVRDALRRHKDRGESIVIWRDNRIVTLPPDEIPSAPADGNPT